MRKVPFLCLVVLVMLAASSGMAQARDRDEDQDRARNALRRNEAMPIAQILTLVAQHLPGDVIGVKLEARRNRLYYEIKVLTPSGRVRELTLDARTGAYIGIED